MKATDSNQKDITIRKAVSDGIEILKQHKIDNAAYDSFALLADLMDMDRTYYFVHGDDLVPEAVMDAFQQRIQQRADHIPLQHILGKAYFYGYEFLVNGNVLVPRPDTEVLIEEVRKIAKPEDKVLDMCTGSGCIILTLAKEGCLSTGYGADISEAALQVATENKKRLQADQVTLIQSDLFSAFEQMHADCDRFDVIVSNPPYIRTDVIDTLSPEVRLHDPMIALDGLADGLHFYREITRNAVDYLKSGGWLCYEIGFDQAEDVSKIMRSYGYTDITTVKDLNGLDRVVKGRLK